MKARWIGCLVVLLCVLGFAAMGLSANYKPEYKMSIVVGPTTSWGMGGAKFAELVKERTNGRINIKVYYSGQLYAGKQTNEFLLLKQGVADFALASPTRCLVAVPLMLGGKALGALEAFNKSETDYTEEDVTILETLAAAVSLTLGYNKLQHRMESSFSELSELDRLKSDFIANPSQELRTRLGVSLGHAPYLQILADANINGYAILFEKRRTKIGTR